MSDQPASAAVTSQRHAKGTGWFMCRMGPWRQVRLYVITLSAHNLRHIVLAMWMGLTAALSACAVGDAPTAYEKTLDDYVQNASFLIRANIDWRLVQDSEAEAVVVIRLGANGVLESVKLTERSGNPSFDVALESAVRQSIPMLRSPPALLDGVTTLSIPIRFRVLRWN